MNNFMYNEFQYNPQELLQNFTRNLQETSLDIPFIAQENDFFKLINKYGSLSFISSSSSCLSGIISCIIFITLIFVLLIKLLE